MFLSLRTILTLSFMLIFAWSAAYPVDRLTWWLDGAPVMIGVVIVFTTYQKFPLTPLSYLLLWFGAALVLIGAHYTYSEMPLFNQLRELLDLSRNHYDRFGHLFQGFIAAIIFRELLIRTSPLKTGLWLCIVVIGLSTAKSVLYELAEWMASATLGYSANEFLGLQGDEWDAQKDMALALMGSIAALTLLSKCHDKQLKQARYLDGTHTS